MWILFADCEPCAAHHAGVPGGPGSETQRAGRVVPADHAALIRSAALATPAHPTHPHPYMRFLLNLPPWYVKAPHPIFYWCYTVNPNVSSIHIWPIHEQDYPAANWNIFVATCEWQQDFLFDFFPFPLNFYIKSLALAAGRVKGGTIFIRVAQNIFFWVGWISRLCCCRAWATFFIPVTETGSSLYIHITLVRITGVNNNNINIICIHILLLLVYSYLAPWQYMLH